MASDEELEPTQSQSQTMESVWLNVDADPEIWGRLMANYTVLRNFDLTKTTFVAGRESSSDCCFTASNLPPKMLNQLSKQHFKIEKDLSNMSNPVYIEDLSRNGTYINKERIPRKSKWILAHNDVISIGHPAHKAFVYKDQYRATAKEMPADVTSKFHIGRKLGSGACGTVYLVYNYKTCQPFALKHIKRNQLINCKNDKALNEASIMMRLQHPCIVQMYDIINITDSVYITLQYMRGGDLLNRITDKGYLPEKNAKLFFYQMCQAIKYLHNQRITHRDLKPDNILLDTQDDDTLIRISDFGLSKITLNNSVLRTVCGTPLYVAPEILLTGGRGVYTEKVDIWSLGVVLFTELSGTLPFANEYGTLACEQIKNGRFKFLSPNWNNVSKEAKVFITQILNTDVKKRPAIDELIAHKWLRDFDVVAKAHQLMGLPPPHIGDFTPTMEIAELNIENCPPPKRRRLR